MSSHSAISVRDCKLLARQGLAEPIEQICNQSRADGALAKTHDNAEVVVLDDDDLSKGVLWVQVLARGDDIVYPEGSVLKIRVTGKRALILEYSEHWPVLT